MNASLILAGFLAAIGSRGPLPPVAPFGRELLPTSKVVIPLVFPVLGSSSWKNDYNQNRGRYRHTGIDIRAPKMRPIVAPFAGVLGYKVNSFWIYSDDGWACLGTHLNNDTPGTNDNRADFDYMFAPNLRPGDRVQAGQLIGYVGNSGNATGPHLHFEIHGPNGIRNPYFSLLASIRIKTPTQAIPLRDDIPTPNQIRLIGVPRAYDESRRVLMLIRTARQGSDGHVTMATTRIMDYAVLTPEIEETMGGWQQMQALPRDREVSIFGTDQPSGSVKAERMTLHADR